MSTLNEAKNLNALLKIEDDDELIQYTCFETGVAIWPLIRNAFIRTIMSDWLFKSASLTSLGGSRSYLKIAKSTAYSALHNLGYKENSYRRILVQSTGLGNFSHDGLIYDRLVGYFYNAFPDETLIYQDKPKEYLHERYSFDHLLHKSPRNIINKIYSRAAIKKKHRDLARTVIERACENSQKILGFYFDNNSITNLVSSLAVRLAVLPYLSDVYANWFSKQGFKLILKEDACYGGESVALIHAARLTNIVVAEYQHGAISKGHDGYNVSNALAINERFKKVLPDYLLTYGNWWSNQSNMPVKKIAIGNPHLTESIRLIGNSICKLDRVLVLGDGIETELYLNLAKHIYGIVGRHGTIVVFRPHPFERERVKTITLPDGVKLDNHADIYPSLMESRIVISELSTGLFEAVGLVDEVLLWDTEKSRFAFPDIPFKSFSTFEELESILQFVGSGKGVNIHIPANELWEPNWKQNYKNFIDGVIAL